MSFNVQGAKGLTIPEGTVKTIHDKDNRLLWGAVGYNTKYAGDTFQQTIAGNNLFDRANAKENTLLKWADAEDNTDTGSIVASNHISVSEGDTYTSNYAMTPFFYDSSDKYIGVLLANGTSVRKSAGGYFKTFTVPSGYNIAKMCIEYRRGYSENPQDMVSVTDIMCNLGSPVLPYEPYVGGVPSPNPDYPQDIQVVTGEQTVKVCGKNLFDINTLDNGTISVANGVATGTAAQFNSGFGNNTSGIMTPPTGQVTLSATAYTDANGKDEATGGLQISFRYSDGTNTATNWLNNTKTPVRKSITSGTGKTIDKITISFLTGGANIWHISDFQLELGSTATTYEPYQGQSYEVNLGKNLLNLEALATTGIVVSNGVATGTVRSFNAAYGTSSGVPVTFNAKRVAVSLKAYTDAETAGTNNGLKIRAIYKDGTGADIIAFTNDITTATYKTAVTSGTREIDKIAITYGNLPDNTWHITDFQIEAGSTATSYAPYFTPIELCGIGKKPDGTYTYQDYIWRDNDTWKVHKEVGKVVYDGTEDWNVSTNMYFRDGSTFAKIADNNTVGPIASNYFTAVTYNNTYYAHVDYGVALASGANRLSIRNKDCANKASFQAWLSTHNTTVYYQLATPTDTTITDAALISQLNAIEEWMTRYGYVGTVFGNLPIVIDRTTI